MTTADLAASVLRASAHCPPAAALAASVSAPTAVTLVVTSDAADSGCVTWLKHQFPDAVRVVSADADFTADALAADAAVLLLPCWAIPDVRLVGRWLTLSAARPEGTSHVVLDGIEMVKTADDRRKVDALARHLAPTDGEPTAFHWQADEARLRAALDRPLSGEQKQRLNVLRLSHAVQLLEDAGTPAGMPVSPATDPHDDLSRRRAKVLRRVRELRDSVRDTVGLAYDDLGGRFEQRLGELAPLFGKPALAAAVDGIVTGWRPEAEASIQRRVRAELETVAHELPPMPPTAGLSVLDDAPLRDLTADLPADPPAAVGPLTPYLRTAGAAVVTPLAAVAFGVPVLGVIGGTVVATAGVLMYDHMSHARDQTATHRERLRAHLARKVSDAKAVADGRAEGVVHRLLDDCKTAFDREQTAVPSPPAAGPPPTPFAGWRKVLADLS